MLQKYLIRLIPGILTSLVSFAILWFTLAPHPLPQEEYSLFEGADKLVHALMFGTLMLALVIDRELLRQRRYEQTRRMPRRGRFTILWLAVAAILFGTVVELLQMWMCMGRTGDVLDIAADAIGVVLFACISPFVAGFLFRVN